MTRSVWIPCCSPLVWAAGLASLFALSGCGKSDGSTADSTRGAPAAALTSKKDGSKSAKSNKQAGPAIPTAEPRGPEHSVYSLVDNRLSAHHQRGGGLVIPAGSAGFVKYMRFRKASLNWNIRQELDGIQVAIMDGKTGRIDVPLTAEQAGGDTPLRMRVHNDSARALSLRINGKQKQEIGLQMEAGWSTVEATIPDGLLAAGENEILIFTGKGAPMAVAWIQIGGQGFGDDAPRGYDAGKKRLVLPEGGGLSYYVMAPDRGRVTGDLNDAACKVQVTATADGGDSVTGELIGNGSAVDISKLAGKPVRLDLIAAGCKQAHLTGAALVVPGDAPEVERGEPPRHVVLWIMDSLRADRVKPFASKARPDVPTFEKLAATGAAFVQTYVQGNESRVSHASIWSSLYPVKHDMLSSKAKLASKWTTIDEVMRKAGMFTSGVSGNGYVAKKWGFGAAWNKYRNHIHEGGGLIGEDIYDKAVASIDGRTDPWFLYIGTIDTHVSWRPKEPWVSKYRPGYKGRFAKVFSGADAGKWQSLKMSDEEIEWVRAIYDSNVSYQDDLLGKLVDKLGEWGIAEQTMIIVTADHGDEQWEQDRVGHGGSLRETLVHIPLLIHYPQMFPGGLIHEGAEVVDIVPTIADVMGMEMDPEWQGESLLPLAHGVGKGYPRMSMASQYEGAHAARIGGWKLRVSGSGKPELYNLEQEPSETADRADKDPIARRFMSDPLWLLRAYNMDWKKHRWGNAANVKAGFPEHFSE